MKKYGRATAFLLTTALHLPITFFKERAVHPLSAFSSLSVISSLSNLQILAQNPHSASVTLSHKTILKGE